MIKLSIIIVNWNGKHLIRSCLASIYKFIRDIEFEVIVVDNGSNDDSVQLISTEFPLVKMIKNDKNIGFAGGVNKGLEVAKAKYLLLLNNDTELLDNTFLPMIRFMEINQKIGILGCKLKDRTGKAEESCDNFPTFWSRVVGKLSERIYFLRRIGVSMRYWDYNRLREVDVVSGACLLTRRNVVEKIGKFDERFFMYHEDTDFCYRARREGFKIYFFPYSTIIHEYSKSKAWNSIEKKIVHRKTHYLFVKKHYGYLEKSIYKRYFSVISTLFVLYYRLRGNNGEIKKWQEIKNIYI